MRKKIEYVSEKLVKEEFKAFEREIIPALEEKIGEKYRQYFSRSLLHAATSSVWASLYISLYLTSSDFKRTAPSFRQQMCAIHDYMNLLRGIDAPQRFFEKTNYWSCYSKISLLLHEKEQFQKTGEISEEFWRELRSVHKENRPPEHTEQYLNYVEEITKALTEAAVDMVSEQIQNIFPGESAIYRRSLDGVYGSSAHEHIAADGEESSQLTTRKVKFPS
jgi:hypothetical protein